MRKRHRAQNRLHKLTFELNRLGEAMFSFEASLDKMLEKRFEVKKSGRKMFYIIGDKSMTHDQLIEQLEEFKFAAEKIEDAIRSNMDSNDKYTKSYIRKLDSLLEKGPKMHRGELPAVSQILYKLEMIDSKLVRVDENYDEPDGNKNDGFVRAGKTSGPINDVFKNFPRKTGGMNISYNHRKIASAVMDPHDVNNTKTDEPPEKNELGKRQLKGVRFRD